MYLFFFFFFFSSIFLSLNFLFCRFFFSSRLVLRVQPGDSPRVVNPSWPLRTTVTVYCNMANIQPEKRCTNGRRRCFFGRVGYPRRAGGGGGWGVVGRRSVYRIGADCNRRPGVFVAGNVPARKFEKHERTETHRDTVIAQSRAVIGAASRPSRSTLVSHWILGTDDG